MTLAASPRAEESLTVMADPSLSLAMSEIARDYARTAKVTVTASYMPPAVQQQQITDGAAADLLLTPLASWIEELKTQGVIDVYSPTPVAKNRLALAGPPGGGLEEVDWEEKFPAARIITLLDRQPGFAVGSPDSLTEGVYAREALQSLGALWYLEPYTLYVKRLEEMFAVVAERGGFGLFFYSTVLDRPGIRVIGLVPEKFHTPIQYYAVVVAGENMSEARKFLDYLKTEPAQIIFRQNGV